MNKKTILEISLYAQYYKKDITDRYMINNKSLIITNDAIDILDKPQEKLYIESWTKKIEKNKEIERLNNIIDELEKDLTKVLEDMYNSLVHIDGRGYYSASLVPLEDELNKLKGSDKDE